jgi:segregation and condensation protein A
LSSNYFLKINQFEGPLDLLLHLIKVNEIDVFNIDIYLLTSQYLEYLRLIEFDDLADAGEFLEMAATLIEIKSRMLLPTEKSDAEEELDDDDPRKPLQDRLVEYETFCKIAEYFEKLPQVGVDIQTNHEFQRLETVYEDCEAPLKGDSTSLVILWEQMLRDFSERKPPAIHQAKMHLVSVEEKIEELTEHLKTAKFSLFQGFYDKFQSRYELIAYILAVLEMTRWKKLKVYQQEILGPMWIYPMEADESTLPFAAALKGNHSELEEYKNIETTEA